MTKTNSMNRRTDKQTNKVNSQSCDLLSCILPGIDKKINCTLRTYNIIIITSRTAGTKYDFWIMVKVRMLIDGILNDLRNVKHLVAEQPENSMLMAM